LRAGGSDGATIDGAREANDGRKKNRFRIHNAFSIIKSLEEIFTVRRIIDGIYTILKTTERIQVIEAVPIYTGLCFFCGLGS
jgi:hypothetical protein